MNEAFIKNIISMRGKAGKKWLDDIPSIIKNYEKQWKLKVMNPFTLTYNYVAPVIRSDGSYAVLKIGFPKDKDIRREIHTLQAFNGEGAVKILKSDPENAVMLLEKIEPGDFLKTIKNDKERISVFADIIKKLQKAEFNPTDFYTLKEWGGSFERLRRKYNGTTGPFPTVLFEKAEKIFNKYCQENNNTLLHGDLHDKNILLSERGWLAIDPKGIVGDPVYETAMLLHETYMVYQKALIIRRSFIEELHNYQTNYILIKKGLLIGHLYKPCLLSYGD